MAQQVINIGLVPNDGTGDALRVALDKVNTNFEELYEAGAATSVQPDRLVSAGTGLTGGGSLAADRTFALSAGVLASLALADAAVQPEDIGTAALQDSTAFATASQGATADTAVQPERAISAGSGLTGGGDLSTDRSIALSMTSIASLALAEGALQPGGGQVAYSSVSIAQSATVPAVIKRLQTQFFVPNYAVPATLVGGARYRRISFADLTGFPSLSYFRSGDRFLPDGSTSSTNGGYWVIDEDLYLPEMFGAVQDFNGTSGTDCFAALSAMIAVAKLLVGSMKLKMGKGYFSSGSITLSNMSFTLSGDGFGSSSIIFGNAGDGLVISQDDYKHATSIEALSIFTTRQEMGAGLKITYSSADSIGNRNVSRCRVIDVECRGYDIMSQGWTKGMVLTDVHRASIVRYHSTGRRNISAGGVAQFLYMTSGAEVIGSYPPTFTAIPSDINFDSPRIDQCVNAIKSLGEVEGLIVNTPTFVAVDTGVFGSYSTTRPMVKVAGGHINCFTFAVKLVNAPQSSISDLLIYKFQDCVNDTVAVSLDACDDTSVKNLSLINQAANKTINGEWNGVVVNNSARCTIADIRHPSPSKTVILSGTTTLTHTSGLKPDGTYLNATVQTYDDSSSGSNEYSGNNKFIANVQNASGVVITGSGTVIASHGPIKVNKGERYSVQAFINATKGATAGEFIAQVDAPVSGGAVAIFGAGRTSLLERSDQSITQTVGHTLSGVLTITATGSLTFRLIGTSTGSNSDVIAGDGQLSIVKL